jgi:hypothetical protein
MRTFYTESDIDDLVASGVHQLQLGTNVFLTDAARERAEDLGVALVIPGEVTTGKALVQTAPAKSEPLPSRPRGCQHGPLNMKNNQSETNKNETNKSGSPIVDQLVDAVSALKKRGG